MGVLCHETGLYEEAAMNYEAALRAIDDSGIPPEDGIDLSGKNGENDVLRHPDNSMFWNYVDTGVVMDRVLNGERGEQINDNTFTFCVGVDLLPLTLFPSDHVRLDNGHETQVVILEENIIPTKTESGDRCNNEGEKRFTLQIKDAYHTPEISTSSLPSLSESNKTIRLFVKKDNRRLRSLSAVSIAFNIARLHEAAGRTMPAVELHKAILRSHPSYVNSYLRLACIARDCGSLIDCSEWLKSAVEVAPGNSEVLALVGNLHLSLCDWQPAQSVFNQLLTQKVPNVESYSMLCLGNIYFNNLKTPKKYNKHLQNAAHWYKRILSKDKANAYAANGLGTVLAEKGDLIHAKEAFNRVREVSSDTVPDALLNLGHIYLAQKKHPEALQMYQSYMCRTRSAGTPVTSRSRDEDDAEVLLYVAFAYFDWARQAESFGDTRAAPADERYGKCVEHIELAIKRSKRENVTLRYNWCMSKLQAANCVLQKLTRNIRRTAKEVKDSLEGLEESLPLVQVSNNFVRKGTICEYTFMLMHEVYVYLCIQVFVNIFSPLFVSFKIRSD